MAHYLVWTNITSDQCSCFDSRLMIISSIWRNAVTYIFHKVVVIQFEW